MEIFFYIGKSCFEKCHKKLKNQFLAIFLYVQGLVYHVRKSALKLFTKQQNFGPDQIECICRRQNKCDSKTED